MKSRIEDFPKLKTESSQIEGTLYNQARLALIRLDNPLRLKLPGLRGMDMLLDTQAWVCVDRTLYDLPVLAWTSFEHSDRNSLHQPVRCVLHYYHLHADLISGTILETVSRELGKQLNKHRAQSQQLSANIAQLNPRP